MDSSEESGELEEIIISKSGDNCDESREITAETSVDEREMSGIEKEVDEMQMTDHPPLTEDVHLYVEWLDKKTFEIYQTALEG